MTGNRLLWRPKCKWIDCVRWVEWMKQMCMVEQHKGERLSRVEMIKGTRKPMLGSLRFRVQSGVCFVMAGGWGIAFTWHWQVTRLDKVLKRLFCGCEVVPVTCLYFGLSPSYGISSFLPNLYIFFFFMIRVTWLVTSELGETNYFSKEFILAVHNYT